MMQLSLEIIEYIWQWRNINLINGMERSRIFINSFVVLKSIYSLESLLFLSVL